MTVNVMAVAGSLRDGSYTKMALNVAVEGARRAGGEVTVVDLVEWRLPLYDDGPSLQDPVARRFMALAEGADALLVATPVYHDSYSGVLKNALDYLYRELNGKVAGLIAVAGGRVGAGLAMEHLRTVFRETSTWVLSRQVPIGNSDEAFDASGRPRDQGTEERLLRIGRELVEQAKILRPKTALFD